MFCGVVIYLKNFNQLINLFKFSPKKVNNKHKKRDKNIYKKASKNFLLINNSTLSNEKVENVVKDPRIPIIKKYLKKSWDKFLFPINIIMYPIKKEPTIFTIRVLINKKFGKKKLLELK